MPEDKSESESDSLPSSNFTISNIQTGDFTIKQRLNSARRQIIVATFFLGLALLPILVRKKEMLAAYIVLLMGLLWMTEVIPLAVTAFLPVIFFPIFGILPAKRVSIFYLTDSNFVFVGSIIMAVAVEESRLHERIALRVLTFTGSNPRRLLLGFQLTTASLSLWISNTAATAMIVPIAMAVFKELRIHNEFKLRKIENIPLHWELVKKETIFDFQNIPRREKNIYKAILLSICYSATIGGTGTLIGTGPNIVLNGFLEKIYSSETPITFATWMLFTIPQIICIQLFCWLWLQYIFIPIKCDEEENDGSVAKMLRRKYERLGSMKFDERLVLILFSCLVFLWLFREPKVVPGWSSLFSHHCISDGTVAMLMAFLLFIVPSENPLKPPRNGQQYSTLMTWNKMKEKFSWSTMLLLGGGYAMAEGVEKSGLSDVLGSQLGSFTSLPRWLFISASSTLITVITEFSSNIATASIFIPLVNSIAKQNRTNPLFYILPTTMACSFAFILPAATPPNAIVFSSKMVKVVDMVKAGIVMNAFAMAVAVICTYTYASILFDLQSYPDWAEYNHTSSH